MGGHWGFLEVTEVLVRFWIAVVVFSLAVSAGAVPQPELTVVTGDQSRSFLGRGVHVLIGILDGGIDATHPAIRGSIVAARDFSGSGTTDDDPKGPGHATGIAGLYVGHASDYMGLVPKAGIINARVITSNDSTSDLMAGNGLFYSVNLGAKVVNMSFGNKLGEGPLTNRFNLMVDYASEAYGVSIVTAAGNEEDTAVAQVPAGAYNAYSVGSVAPRKYNQVSSFSNFALSSDVRTKPELVAPGDSVQLGNANWEKGTLYSPGSGTSFSAPIVGGVLAQMVGYGRDFHLPTDPCLLRAIVMASADKVLDYGGDAWAPRHQSTTDKGRLFVDEPLDAEQGAGRIDAMAAYRVYSRTHDSNTKLTDWAFTSLKRSTSFMMDLGQLSAGQHLDTTLTWAHHVGVTDNGNGVIDATDKFYEAVPLADFALELLRNGKIIAVSDGDFDNYENLSLKIASSGTYSLEVYRYDIGGNKNETFAVAARVLNNGVSGLPAEASLSAFAAVGGGGVMRSLGEAAVPEPSGVLVIGMAAVGWGALRR